MAFEALDFLEYFGFNKILDHDENNVMASCFMGENHTNDDKKRSFGMRKDTGVSNCYVCGGWNLEQITRELLNRQAEAKGLSRRYNDFDALMFLEEKGWTVDEANLDDIRAELDGIDGIEFKSASAARKEVVYMAESDLAPYLTAMHKRTLQRGDTPNAIDVDTARWFQLGYDKQTKRIIIPVREETGQLVGVVSRATLDTDYIRYGVGTVNPIWLRSQITNEHFDGDKMLWVFDKRDYVYGEHTWYIGEGDRRKLKFDRVLLLESPLDVVYAFAQGLHEYMNIGAIFGSKVTKEQRAKLLRHGTVVEGLDNDKPGEEGRKKIVEDFAERCTLYSFDSFGQKDLGDCTPEQVQGAAARFKPAHTNFFAELAEME